MLRKYGVKMSKCIDNARRLYVCRFYPKLKGMDELFPISDLSGSPEATLTRTRAKYNAQTRPVRGRLLGPS
jgi:hypothetical protein